MRMLTTRLASVALVLMAVEVAAAQEAASVQDTQPASAPPQPGVATPGTGQAGSTPPGAAPQAASPALAGEAAPTASPMTPGTARGAADARGAAAVQGAAVIPPETVDASKYTVRLRDLEQRVNELKEQIFRSKARLSLLAETVLQGVVAGAQARLVHQNKMGASFKLVRVQYALDGAPIFSKADESGALGDREEFDIYNGSIVPGEHTLTVKLEYRGHGYGIFSYLKGYTFKARASHSFNVPEGKLATLTIVGYEKGGPTAPLEDRPHIAFKWKVQASQLGAGEVAP